MIRGLVVWVLAMSCLGGCGGGADTPPLGTVSGIVLLDGKPLEQAEVMFQPEQGRASFGKTNADGRYTLVYTAQANGALIGPHMVVITTAAEAFSDESGDAGGDRKARREILPPRYHAQTELTADVQAGSNTINFELLSK